LKRVRGTREIDESVERALRFRGSLEVSWQSRLTWNHLISKHQMQHHASGFRTRVFAWVAAESR
jgi:hypothetical protein